MLSLTDRAWSPYLTGTIIGLLQIPAFLLLGTALGTSSSYVTVGASLASFVDPGITSIDYAAKHLSGAKNWWQVAVVVGIGLGAFLSSRLSGTQRSGVAPIWRDVRGATTRTGRFVMAFGAGFIMLMGARIADGCTSGHGISGIAQLALGSFIAVGAMFAGGIATAMLMRRS
jgi:uncharacterized membrane protein YedE/YeeE